MGLKTDVAPARPLQRRRRGTGVLALIALPFAVLAVLRLVGIDGNSYTAAALALTPYATAAGLVLGVLTLMLRRWWIGGVVTLLAVSLTFAVVPRLVPEEQPTPAGGRPLRVLSANLYLGQADAKAIVDLVRAHDVDVLNLLELTQPSVNALTDAGLFALLPHRVLDPEPDGYGSGIVSRHPLTELALAKPSRPQQPSARVDLGGGASVEIVAVHPLPPTMSPPDWKSTLGGLPLPTADLPVRILAGDFNATLDHAQLRDLLDAGYTDAGAERGAGFTPTWPDGIFPPPVTIDHVLADERTAFNDYQVFEVLGSDHSAVYAELTIPTRGS
ncbi:endonuclease/exonuclease/phosphatase family protein [Amycolatopsis nigrescens]|uniref:endonuclease/exonuclease/phosphatase family protein n=1 Tax=Amycolatopsis nigrescens TaxID=381445 RepID=UPI000373BD1C|nr:endonuclease/exonuclease/phosphatase family protein [Amycolatopsis nigrescens]